VGDLSGRLDAVSYVFATTWRFEHDADAVYGALADVAEYPSWWPQVRAARRLEEGVGELRCRSLLPYDLTFVMRRDVEDAEQRVLAARLEGDLNGTSRWTVTPGDTGCTAVFDEDVEVGSGMLRAAGRIARPALRFNHDLMMRAGHKGLRAWLDRRISSA
jgi:ribosome-associated toxin RatA of RatAB toxin-antitoxin module